MCVNIYKKGSSLYMPNVKVKPEDHLLYPIHLFLLELLYIIVLTFFTITFLSIFLKTDLKYVFSGHTKFDFDLRKIVESRDKFFLSFVRTKVTDHGQFTYSRKTIVLYTSWLKLKPFVREQMECIMHCNWNILCIFLLAVMNICTINFWVA